MTNSKHFQWHQREVPPKQCSTPLSSLGNFQLQVARCTEKALHVCYCSSVRDCRWHFAMPTRVLHWRRFVMCYCLLAGLCCFAHDPLSVIMLQALLCGCQAQVSAWSVACANGPGMRSRQCHSRCNCSAEVKCSGVGTLRGTLAEAASSLASATRCDHGVC